MWSLTSPRAERISGPEKFRSSARKDFFNSICQKQTFVGRFWLNGHCLGVLCRRETALSSCSGATVGSHAVTLRPLSLKILDFAEWVFTKLDAALLFAVMLAMATNASLVQGLRFIAAIGYSEAGLSPCEGEAFRRLFSTTHPPGSISRGPVLPARCRSDLCSYGFRNSGGGCDAGSRSRPPP